MTKHLKILESCCMLVSGRTLRGGGFCRLILPTGEAQGIRSIFHASSDDALASNSHFWVPKVEPNPLPLEDFNYLYAKGALSLPSSHLCWELIEKYFRYVYPMLPVVVPSTFLASYQRNGPGGVSVLLLQSMFFTASNVSSFLFTR